MPITRTPIVDDDGSGTTGTVLDNAWKQELYNQIDALVNPVTPLIGAFTLVDASGAGLGNIGSGSYWKVGKAVLIVSSFLFPGTANGANNLLTGLPFPTLSTAYAGLYLGYGPVFYRSWTVPGQPQLQLVNGTNSVILTNAQLSGASGHFHGIYFTDEQHGRTVSAQGAQKQHTEKPLKVYAEQSVVGQPPPVGVVTDYGDPPLFGDNLPRVVLPAGWRLVAVGDWVLSNRYTGQPMEVISDDEFQERFGGGPNVVEGT